MQWPSRMKRCNQFGNVSCQHSCSVGGQAIAAFSTTYGLSTYASFEVSSRLGSLSYKNMHPQLTIRVEELIVRFWHEGEG